MTKFIIVWLSLFSFVFADVSENCANLGRDLLNIQNQIFTNAVNGNQLITLQNEYNQKLAELSILENIFVLQHNFTTGFRGLQRMQDVNRQVARERLTSFNEHAQNAIFVQEVVGDQEHLKVLLSRAINSRIMSRGFLRDICGQASKPIFCREYAALSPERQREVGQLMTNLVVNIRTRLQGNTRNRDEVIASEAQRLFSSFNYGDQTIREVTAAVNNTNLDEALNGNTDLQPALAAINSINLGVPGGNYFRASDLQREFSGLQSLVASLRDGGEQTDADKIAKIRASLQAAQRNIQEGSRGVASPIINQATGCLNGAAQNVATCLKGILNVTGEVSARDLRAKKSELEAIANRINEHMANPSMQVLEQLKNYGVLRYRQHCQVEGPRNRSEVISYCDGWDMAQGSYFSKVLSLSDNMQGILLHESVDTVELNEAHLIYLRSKCSGRNANLGDYMCRGLRTSQISLDSASDSSEVFVAEDIALSEVSSEGASSRAATMTSTSSTTTIGTSTAGTTSVATTVATVEEVEEEDEDDDYEEEDDRDYRRRRSRRDYDYDDGSAGWQALAHTMQLGGSALQLGLTSNQNSQYTPQMFPQGTPSYYNPMWNYNANMYLSMAQRPEYFNLGLYGMSTGYLADPNNPNQLAPLAPINFTY